MAFFEGKIFSTINDEMPAKQWDSENFISDWESQIRETNDLFRDFEINVAKETIIKGFYSTYKDLLEIIDEENITEEEKKSITKKLNLAMINVLEYGQRRSKDIVFSLQDKKLSSDEKNSNILNGIINNLIFEVEKADKEFNEELEKRKK